MATSDGGLDYQQVLTEHMYLFSKYIVANDFVDKLISDGVLNLDDRDIILNPYANQSRRERAAKLIEVLHTRGPQGYTKFLEILEYQYPHVFRDVTKQEPRPPPKGFLRNRTSDQLQMINDLPRLAQHIKDQHKQNTDLQEELTVLQGLLEFSKVENAALERDIDTLKCAKQKNDELMIQVSNLESANRDLQADMTKELQRTLRYCDERDESQVKCRDLQLKYDQLVKRYQQLERERPTGAVAVAEPTPSRPPSIPPDVANITENRTQHAMEQRNILRDELEEYKTHAEDLADRLLKSEEDTRLSESKLEKRTKELQKQIKENRSLEDQLRDAKLKSERTKELQKQIKENRSLEDQLRDAKLKSEAYYKLIHEKGDEIYLLNSQKMSEQQRVTKLTQEKNEIFQEKHDLSIKLEEMRVELDKIKARLSGSNQDLSCPESGTDEDQSPQSFEDIADDEQAPVQYFDRTKPRRRPCAKRSVPGRYGSNRRPISPDACFNNPTNFSVLADFDSCELMNKASTLPAGNETPEMFFRREIAIYRYSVKNDRKPPLINQDSITTHPGSTRTHRAPTSPRGPPETVYTGQVPKLTGPTSDVVSKDSGSTVLIPRTGQNRAPALMPSNSVREESVGGDSEDLTSSSSSGGFSLIEDFPPYDLRSELLPKACAQVTSKGLSYRTVLVKYPVVTDRLSDGKEQRGAIEIVGGNHTGIFISKVLQKVVDLAEGEEIKEIVYMPHDRPVMAPLLGCTLEDAFRLMSEEYIRSRKEREIQLKVRKCRLEYDSACKWMGENKGTGDFLFIRCNANMERRVTDDSITPRAGEIFQVKNSRYSKKQWLGYRVNESTGSIDKTEIKIPNPLEAKMRRLPSVNRSLSEDGDSHSNRRKGGVRVRGVTYERVLPMKASVQMPVYVMGHTLVVNALLDLVARQLSTDFRVKATDCGGSNDGSYSSRNDIHMVRRCSIDKMSSVKPYQRILILVNVTGDIDEDTCSHLFGEALSSKINREVVETSASLKQKITEAGYKFEELSLPEIHRADKLLETFVRCVSCSQSRTLWLSSEEMDDQVANKHPRYLGHRCDLNNIMTEVQHAQSLDHSIGH